MWLAFRSFAQASFCCMLLVPILAATGAVVGPSGYTNSFTAQPSAADWATFGRSGAPSDTYDSDTDVNTSITAAAGSAQTTATATDPPATSTVAMWSSTGLYLQTRPKTVRFVALMGKFLNNTGTNATQIRLSYLNSIVAGGTAEDNGKGTRVYYSTTGLANSWTNIPALNHIPTANVSSILSATVSLSWTNGGSLYFLWVDDNSNNVGDDAANQLDNFSLAVTAGTSVVATVSLISPLKATVAALGTALALSAVVIAPSGNVLSVEFYDGTNIIGVVTKEPFTMSWVQSQPGIHNISARLTTDKGLQANSTPVVVEFAPTRAQTILYPDFSQPGGLLLGGATALVLGRGRLTPALPRQVGGLWLDSYQSVEDGFETVFQFQISQPTGTGAEGFAFLIVHADGPELGESGAGLGYSSVPSCLVVEFDMFQNPETMDPDGNHISIHSRGVAPNRADETASLGRTTVPFNMSDGLVHTVVIHYAGAMLEVFLDDLNFPLLAVPVALGPLLDLHGDAGVGFTSSTGVESQIQDILMWSFRQNVPPQIRLAPLEAGSLLAPHNILLLAEASDSDGDVRRVEFYANGNFIGAVTAAPFTISWDNPPAGTNLLMARAVDDLGATTTSAPVTVPIFPIPRIKAILNHASMVLEFPAVSGLTYTVQYSDDLLYWSDAVPSIHAEGGIMTWQDTGPPATDSPPAGQMNRFYRVVVTP